MSEQDHVHDTNDSAPIQIDVYGVKLPAGKADAESRPATWLEVGRRVNQHLMTVVERLFGRPPIFSSR